MAKLTLNTIGSRYGSIDALNANFDAIEAALENTVSRDGSIPNTMDAPLDMDSNRIINLTDGINNQDAVTLKQVNGIIQASSSGLIASLRENYVATSGQTVFNLASIEYVPGSNNLAVYLDGVRQYPGTSYTETDINTITFSAGLHTGALVMFISNESVDTANLNASAINYTPAGTGAVATTVQAKLREIVSVLDFGAVADWNGTTGTDNTTAINAAAAFAVITGKRLYIPAGYYRVTGQLKLGGVVFGDAGVAVSTAFYGSIQYNNIALLGTGTVIVWDKTVLTTTSKHIIPVSSSYYNGSFEVSGITFSSTSSGGFGGGTLLTFRDEAASDSFTGAGRFPVVNCRILNMSIGLTLDRVSGFSADSVVFNGCSNFIWAGDSNLTPTGLATDVTISNSYMQGCGADDGSTSCAYLKRIANFTFRDCTIQGTSFILVDYSLGNLTFDHCWIEAQSAYGNYWLVAEGGGLIQTITLDNCYAGASTIGILDLASNTAGGNLVLVNSFMSGMDIQLSSAQSITQIGATSTGTITGGSRNLFVPTLFKSAGPITERNLNVPMGEWTTPTFNAANFSASASMTWTVSSGNVLLNSYSIVGKTLTWQISIASTTTAGTASTELIATIPEGYVAVGTQQYGAIQFYNGSSWSTLGIWRTSGSTVRFFVDASEGTNWPLVSGNIFIRGVLTLQVA